MRTAGYAGDPCPRAYAVSPDGHRRPVPRNGSACVRIAAACATGEAARRSQISENGAGVWEGTRSSSSVIVVERAWVRLRQRCGSLNTLRVSAGRCCASMGTHSGRNGDRCGATVSAMRCRKRIRLPERIDHPVAPACRLSHFAERAANPLRIGSSMQQCGKLPWTTACGPFEASP